VRKRGCKHARQSGRLSLDAIGALSAFMVCDCCGRTLGLVKNATVEARALARYPSYLAAFGKLGL